MKRSQIFLGASAMILAIAGAFASKASNKTALVNGYVYTANKHNCTVTVQACFTQGFNTCKTTAGQTAFKTKGTCVNRLFTQQL